MNGKPNTPHEKMTALDAEGAAYYLRNVVTVLGGHIPQADVMAHGPDWVELRCEGETGYKTWLQWSHVVGYELWEG